MSIINVAKDFTRYPAGRFKSKGATSGEAFREKFLIPNVKSGKKFTIELDGTIGYGSSFLEEAFGGTVRELRISADDFLALVNLVSDDTSLILEIKQYITEAGKRLI